MSSKRFYSDFRLWKAKRRRSAEKVKIRIQSLILFRYIFLESKERIFALLVFILSIRILHIFLESPEWFRF